MTQTTPVSPPIDAVGVQDRIDRITARSLKKSTKLEALKLALRMCDLTTLDPRDTPGKVKQLCYKAMHLHDGMPDIPQVAAVCVYAPMVATAKSALKGSSIKVAAVSTAFPTGMADLEFKLSETKRAVSDGADEIDMVISRGRFYQGDFNYVADEIAQVKQACGPAHLKVILETCELSTLDNVRKASDLALYAGADFIKTSTGKSTQGATLPVTLVMLEAIRDYYYATGRRVGMKPAGGVASAKLALQYLVMLRETLGNDWMTPDLYRFGASALANDILRQIVKAKTGIYQSLDYFSID